MSEKKHTITCICIDGGNIAVFNAQENERFKRLNWKKGSQCKRKIKGLITLLNSLCYTVDQESVNEIIEYYNQSLGKRLNPKTESYKKIIQARLDEGYSVEDFKTVIDNKVADWGCDSKMAQNLKPSTLFRACHFDEYLNSVTAKEKNNHQSYCQY